MTSLANRFFTNRSESNIPREGFRSQRRIYCCFLGCQSFRNRKMRKPFFLMFNDGIEVIRRRLNDLHHMCLHVEGVCDKPLPNLTPFYPILLQSWSILSSLASWFTPPPVSYLPSQYSNLIKHKKGRKMRPFLCFMIYTLTKHPSFELRKHHLVSTSMFHQNVV